MVQLGFGLALQFWDNPLCQNFAWLDSPLIEGINIPDDALSEDGMLNPNPIKSKPALTQSPAKQIWLATKNREL